mmetsp:Transcript_18132/g.49482  ORF Transcript_18132/g.49482 Transcript_18132/m.49482 type:complete len:93 (-) Transcript_18132:1443-1721(-)
MIPLHDISCRYHETTRSHHQHLELNSSSPNSIVQSNMLVLRFYFCFHLKSIPVAQAVYTDCAAEELPLSERCLLEGSKTLPSHASRNLMNLL